MRAFVDRYFFAFLSAGVCLVLASHALQQGSHPGAALWVIAFILCNYLRELICVGAQRNKLSEEINAHIVKRDEHLDKVHEQMEEKDFSFQRDINHITYDAETNKWTKEERVYNPHSGKWEIKLDKERV